MRAVTLLLLVLSILTTGGGATLRGGEVGEGGDEVDEITLADGEWWRCKLTGGEHVARGWNGKDTGSNYCNSCDCSDNGLVCTAMACAPTEEEDEEEPGWADRSSCAALPGWLATLLDKESTIDCTWVRYGADGSDVVEEASCECLPPHMVTGHKFKQRCEVEGTCVKDPTCAEEPVQRCFVNWQLCVAGGTATVVLLLLVWLCCRGRRRCCCCRRKEKEEDIEKRLRRRRRSWCWSRCCCCLSYCCRGKDEPETGLYGRTFALEKQRGGPAVTGVAFV
jgi:hypothetical protein